MKLQCLVIAIVSLLWLMPAQAEPDANSFEWAPEFNVGDTFPDFSLRDQNGEAQNAASLSGDKGYLISFNRSVVW